MNWQLLWMALGLALIIEGLPYFLHPAGSLRALRLLENLGPSAVRALGLSTVVGGIVALLVGRYLTS
jgi:uncharacterized protein YjeT (DUF2065 family)